MKNFIVSALLSAAVLVCAALPAKAQDPKPYVLLNGGTNKVVGMATNPAITLNVSEYTDVTLQATCAAPGGASNLFFFIFRSINSTDYESTLFQTFPVPSSSTTNTAVMTFSVGGASTLKIVPANTNSGSHITNIFLTARFKAPKSKLTTQ